MRVVINLNKTAGPRQLIEVLHAVKTHSAARRSHLDPLSLVTALISRGIHRLLAQLERFSDWLSGKLLKKLADVRQNRGCSKLV